VPSRLFRTFYYSTVL